MSPSADSTSAVEMRCERVHRPFDRLAKRAAFPLEQNLATEVAPHSLDRSHRRAADHHATTARSRQRGGNRAGVDDELFVSKIVQRVLSDDQVGSVIAM